jgi:hypothetical protein
MYTYPFALKSYVSILIKFFYVLVYGPQRRRPLGINFANTG